MLVTAKLGRCAVESKDVKFLVDTGAFHTVLSPALMRQLQLDAPIGSVATTADNRQLGVRIGAAYRELEGRNSGISVAEMDLPMPLPGVSALEALGFKANPVAGRLEPTRPFGPAVL